MNHCLIQAVINSAPQMRYTKENQTPIAEMIVNFKGLRSEDPTRDLKIIGWGNICLLYTSPSPRDTEVSRMPSSA